MTSSSRGSAATAAEAPTISVTAFCRVLGISRLTYYNRVREGKLPRANNGIPLAEAQAYLDAQVAKAAALAQKLRPSTATSASTDAGTEG